MGSTTPIHGYRYPASGDAVNVPVDIENLANDLDASTPVVTDTTPAAPVAGLVWYAPTAGTLQVWDGTAWQPIIQGAWTAYTPAMSNASTGAALASSAQSGKYTLTGTKTCTAQGILTAGVTTTQGAAVSLPLPAKARDLDIGTMVVFGSNSTIQTGLAELLSDLGHIVAVTAGSAFVDAQNGWSIRWAVTYELP